MTYKTHPQNVDLVKKHLLSQYPENTIPVIPLVVEGQAGLLRRVWRGEYYSQLRQDRFVEYEECDRDWLEFFGLTDQIKIYVIPYWQGTAATWQGDSFKFGGWIESYCYEDHGN